MRNVVLALFTALVFLLGACNTSAPQPAACAANETTCDGGDNGGDTGGNTGGDTGGNNGGDTGTTNNGGNGDTGGTTDGNTGGNNGGNNGGQPTIFDSSLMKGIVSGYQGNKVLTVKSLWIDQSNGQIVELGTDPNARLELNGEFGVRLGTPGDASLATLPLPGGCIETTTVPAGLTEVKGALVPALFVFDGDQLVGLILHGSYYLDEWGNFQSGKLAMRVYSATDKIIATGECSAEFSLDAVNTLNNDSIGNALKQFGVGNFEVSNIMQTMSTNADMSARTAPSLTVNLSVNVGLKKGWNTVVLGAELSNTPVMTAAAAAPQPALNVTLIDDTQPNFTWYFLDLRPFIASEKPVEECPEVVALNNTGEPVPGACGTF